MNNIAMNRVYFSIIFIFFILIIFFVFFNSLPYNPIKTKSTLNKVIINTVVPESWGFFTRNPHERTLFVYKKINGFWVSDTRQKQTSLHNLFGIKRNAKKYGFIMSNICPALSWDSSYCSIRQLLAQKLFQKPISITNYEKDYIEPGEYMVVSKEIIPWSWRSQENNFSELLYYKRLILN